MTAERTIVLVPAFNEAAHLPSVLERLRGESRISEVVVVDDGSRDATGAVARAHGATVLRHPFNLGYGAALQTGYKYALESGADVLVQLDADGQHDPRLITGMLQRLDEAGADLVIGSRFLEPTNYRMGRIRTLGRLAFQRLARASGLLVTDPTSGFQVMRRSMLELYAQEFFPTDYPDVDVLLIAHRSRRVIVEHPVVMHAATRPSTLHGGLRSFYYIYRLGLSLWAGAGRSS